MINIKFLLSKKNLLTPIYREAESCEYKFIEELGNIKKAIFYDAFLTDSDAAISSQDWCIISEPYNGGEYIESCDKITSENGRKVFYGQEGTRCLLIDAVKIIGTTNILLQEIKQIVITDEMLQEYNSEPLSFMEEDLLE